MLMIAIKLVAHYRLLRRVFRELLGATIRLIKKRKSSIELSLEEAKNGEVAGPFSSVKELMEYLRS